MSDREEKVLKGLECCAETISKACPMECPYRVECLMQEDGSQMYSVMHDALKLLKEQSKQRFFVDSDGKMTPLPIQPQWICVKDGLPNRSGNYLVYFEGCLGTAMKTAYWLKSKQKWLGAEAHSTLTDVTHWMTLPEPPEEVKQDD